LVLSEIGDACGSEWDCGPGQGCVLDPNDGNNDNHLEATCQLQGSGGNVGSECTLDSDCRNTLCTLGHCSQVCSVKEDCPQGTGCETIPRLVNGSATLFEGCLQNTGVLATSVAMDAPSGSLLVPMPSSAKSLAMVTKVDDGSHLVGATRVVSPSGQLLFRESSSIEEFLSNAIRYSRSKQVSTLLVPNDNALSLETGMYQIDVEASLPPFGPGTAIPKVTLFYKFSESRILDLHFYFLDLTDHPCESSFDVPTLSAGTADESKNFQDIYRAEIKQIFSQANIVIGNVDYEDIDRADLDGIVSTQDLNDLFRLAHNTEGLAIFLVRSLSPDGVQTLGTSIPGPPRTPGTASSGVAVSMDTLCYRSWETLARVTAHSMAAQMGLWDNRDPEGIVDPISDSDMSSENLMFFGEFGGTDISPGQSRVLGLYPGLR